MGSLTKLSHTGYLCDYRACGVIILAALLLLTSWAPLRTVSASHCVQKHLNYLMRRVRVTCKSSNTFGYASLTSTTARPSGNFLIKTSSWSFPFRSCLDCTNTNTKSTHEISEVRTSSTEKLQNSLDYSSHNSNTTYLINYRLLS